LKQATINFAKRVDERVAQVIDQGLNLLDPLSNRYLALSTPNGVQIHMMVSDHSGRDRFPDGVKLNAGGEGRVEDIGNQVVIKRGSVVDPNEVDMLNALPSLTVYTHCKILKVLQGRGFSVLGLNLYCICSGIIVNTNAFNTLQ
jgi:hypothetical protein